MNFGCQALGTVSSNMWEGEAILSYRVKYSHLFDLHHKPSICLSVSTLDSKKIKLRLKSWRYNPFYLSSNMTFASSLRERVRACLQSCLENKTKTCFEE